MPSAVGIKDRVDSGRLVVGGHWRWRLLAVTNALVGTPDTHGLPDPNRAVGFAPAFVEGVTHSPLPKFLVQSVERLHTSAVREAFRIKVDLDAAVLCLRHFDV